MVKLATTKTLMRTRESIAKVKDIMPRVLSISYDEMLLRTRTMMLNERGIEVEPALNFSMAVHACMTCDYDLAVICHSIPEKDRGYIIKQLRSLSSAPILVLRQGHKMPMETADYNIDSGDPKAFVDCIVQILNIPI